MDELMLTVYFSSVKMEIQKLRVSFEHQRLGGTHITYMIAIAFIIGYTAVTVDRRLVHLVYNF